MRAEIAVATVQGKPYYMIVAELKRRNIPFISLIPTDPVPIETKVVITTEDERDQVKHERILAYHNEMDVETLINEALQLAQGKESYGRVTIGIDPGEIFSLAVLADGKVVQTENCFSIEETATRIEFILNGFEDTPIYSLSVKIGDGVRPCKEKLLHALDMALPTNVVLESVSEAGTNRNLDKAKHRRGLRDIVSAIKIAGRNGHTYQRGKTNESSS